VSPRSTVGTAGPRKGDGQVHDAAPLRGDRSKQYSRGTGTAALPPDPHLVQDKSMKGLILAQSERWRRGLGMQVERETGGNSGSKAAKG
jgi:hypothetical protein